MSYVRTAGMSTAARRRRRRAALVLTALVAILAAIGLYALAYFQGWLGDADGKADTDQITATATAPTLAPADVTINVYNASGASGIAGRTAEALASHGYTIDAVDNAPVGTETPEVAAIHHGPSGEEGAKLLQEIVPGATLVADTRESAEIDLYIGTDFVEVEPDESPATSTDPASETD